MPRRPNNLAEIYTALKRIRTQIEQDCTPEKIYQAIRWCSENLEGRLGKPYNLIYTFRRKLERMYDEKVNRFDHISPTNSNPN